MQKKKKKERSDRAGIKDIRERRNWVRFLKAAAASRGAVYFRGVLGRAKRGCAGESLSSADKLKDGNSVSRVLTPRSLLQRRQQNQILWSRIGEQEVQQMSPPLPYWRIKGGGSYHPLSDKKATTRSYIVRGGCDSFCEYRKRRSCVIFVIFFLLLSLAYILWNYFQVSNLQKFNRLDERFVKIQIQRMYQLFYFNRSFL